MLQQPRGLKGFPAKKALQNYNRLGGASTKRAIELLAQADLDLRRGAKDLDAELIMEVLVAQVVEAALTVSRPVGRRLRPGTDMTSGP